MKKLRISLFTLLVVLCTALGMVFAVACGESEPPATTDYYTVTVAAYDQTKGSVSVSPAAAAEGYVADETVTITATAVEGCFVEEVSVNGTVLTAGTDGKYTFTVSQNSTVSVIFSDELNIPAGLAGTWTNLDAENSALVVAADSITWNGVKAKNVEIDDSFGCFVSFEAGEYIGEFNYTDGVNILSITIRTEDYTVSYDYRLRNAAITILADATYAGNYSQLNGEGTLTVAQNGSVSIDGTAVSLDYDGFAYSFSYKGADNKTYVGSLNFDYSSRLHITEFLTVYTDGEPEGEEQTVEFLRDPLPYFNIDPSFRGTWTDEDGATFTVMPNNDIIWTEAGKSVTVKAIGGDSNSLSLVYTEGGVSQIISAVLMPATDEDFNILEGKLCLTVMLSAEPSVEEPMPLPTVYEFVKELEVYQFSDDFWYGDYDFASEDEDGIIQMMVPFTKFTASAEGLVAFMPATDPDSGAEITAEYNVYVVSEVNGVTVLINGTFYTLSLDQEEYGLNVSVSGDAEYLAWYAFDTSVIVIESGNIHITGYEDYEGTVTYAPQKGSYAFKDVITLTVTPEEDYEVELVSVNGEPLYATSEEDGVMTFDYTLTRKNVTITVNFKVALAENANVNVGEEWCGEWRNISGDTMLVLAENGAAFVDADHKVTQVKSASSATVSGVNTLTVVAADDINYKFTWYTGFDGIRSDYVTNKIMVLNNDGGTKNYFVPAEKTIIDDDFDGSWYNQYGPGTLTIDVAEGTASFTPDTPENIVNAAYIVSLGFVDTIPGQNEGEVITVNHQCLFIILEDGGDIYFIGWYEDATSAGQEYGRAFNNPTVTTPAREEESGEFTVTHRSFINEVYIDPLLDGTWTNIDSPFGTTIEISVSDKTAKYDGEDVAIYNYGGTKGSGNIIYVGDMLYSLEADAGTEKYLIKTEAEDTYEEVEDESGSLVPQLQPKKRDYFVKGTAFATVPEESALRGTTWLNEAKDKELAITADGGLTYTGYFTIRIFVADVSVSAGVTSCYIVAVFEDPVTQERALWTISYTSNMSGSINVADGYAATIYTKKTDEEVHGGQGFLGLEKRTYTFSYDSLTVTDTEINITYCDANTNLADQMITQDMLTEITDAGELSATKTTFAITQAEHIYKFTLNDKNLVLVIKGDCTDLYDDNTVHEIIIIQQGEYTNMCACFD